MLKFEFPKQFHARHNKLRLCSWVQSLMDVCINVFHTNAIYKHVHHGEWHQIFFDKIKGEKKNLKFFHGM
jgi:hypothetical protein